MTFDKKTHDAIDSYVRAHIASEDWHLSYFNFISNAALAKRLGEEFMSARYIYKLMEGLESKEWFLRA